MHHHLGHVFLSHTAVDKSFVRDLTERLRSDGFQVWLDERDLVAGDPLGQKIGEALATAKVVLVVVSGASVASKWLRYELNIATDRMIKGECRVIPIVIDDTSLPSEVRGLLYADCRVSLNEGLPAIVTALQHESRRAAMQRAFWSRARTLIREVFGGDGFASLGGEYHSRDYDCVWLPLGDLPGNDETTVFSEVISNHLEKPEPLTPEWFDDYVRATQEIPEELSLIVTERPVGFPVDARHPLNNRVSLRRLQMQLGADLFTSRLIVVADLAGLVDETEQSEVLRLARGMLIDCAGFLLDEGRRRRIRREPAG